MSSKGKRQVEKSEMHSLNGDKWKPAEEPILVEKRTDGLCIMKIHIS